MSPRAQWSLAVVTPDVANGQFRFRSRCALLLCVIWAVSFGLGDLRRMAMCGGVSAVCGFMLAAGAARNHTH